ncbi:MAG TPA: reductive dehalogenase [Dehalococcoidia bacterium]|nr:reductive dehalogenase [Dehalococcoidia bacterium]
MKPNLVANGADRYVVGKVKRFDQKNNVFFRATWDPSLVELGRQFYGVVYPKDRPGYRLEDMAFNQAGWYAEQAFAMGNLGGNRGLYSWETPKIWYSDYRPPTDLRLAVDDSSKMSQVIKKVAKAYGASLVGICELDQRWLYSHCQNVLEKKYEPVEIPEEYKYAIALAFEMNYELIKLSPTHTGAAGPTCVYGRMPLTTGSLAQFIRYLGYKAIPMGNDTALSIPIAVDAGLGELSRIGILITKEYGPRVRLSKIFTDLPLVPDSPMEFGVWDFCMKCEKCTRFCPGQAIMRGSPTDKINNICNREGLLRWPVNAEKCFSWWARSEGICSNCIRVCPFNKLPGWLHETVRCGVKNTRWLDSLFVKADDLLGYGKRSKVEHFWSS